MDVKFGALGPSGHVEASFVDDEVVVEFNQTSPSERGMVSNLIEKGTKEGMTLYTVKKDARKPLEDDRVLEKIMATKGKLALKGTAETVTKLFKILLDLEIEGGRRVLEAQEDGTWKRLAKGEFKEKEGKKQDVKSTSFVGAG